jgi:hypothetical protein
MQKRRFLQKTGVSDEQQAMRNAWIAALRTRNSTHPIYAEHVSSREAEMLRAKWDQLLHDISSQYNFQVSDDVHVQNISAICDVLSHEFAPILYGQRFRIGISQKALNLYLKFLWCLDLTGVPPPHCPIDGTVLQKAGIVGAWTQLDSSEVYMRWINRLREHAAANGYSTLWEWELAVW